MNAVRRADPGIRFSFCASCKTRRRFEYVCEQRWPDRVAQRAGLPSVVQIWKCSICQTSVTRFTG